MTETCYLVVDHRQLLLSNNNQKSLRSRFSNTLRSSSHDIEVLQTMNMMFDILNPPSDNVFIHTCFSGILFSWTVMLIPFPCAYKSNLSQNANTPFFADASLVCIASKWFQGTQGEEMHARFILCIVSRCTFLLLHFHRHSIQEWNRMMMLFCEKD